MDSKQTPPAGSNELILWRLNDIEKNRKEHYARVEKSQEKRDTRIDAYIKDCADDRADLRLSMTEQKGAIKSIEEDVSELKSKSNRNDLWTGIVSTVAAVLTSVGITWNK